MTRYLIDVASYQGKLTATAVKAAGFTAVNLKISHGLTRKSVHPDLGGWIDQARALGLGVSTFHFMTADGTGEEQAEYAYGLIRDLGLLYGTAHQLDVESDPAPALSSVRSYLIRMQQLLRRPVALYSGDWWWKARGWNVADLTPYLWSAPNAGYLLAYPGDTSSHWTAGYGGWAKLAVMQYAVKPLAGIDVSMSAIRDPDVWNALTGGPDVAWTNIPAANSLVAEFNEIAPNRDKASDGSIGDGEHATGVSDHNPDETGNTGGVEDSDSINEVHARDVDNSGPWPAGWTMERFVQVILARCRTGAEKRLRYVIYNRRIWRRSNGWVVETYDGPNPHDHHAHFSFLYGAGSGTSNPENITSPWGILAAVKEGDDMNATEMTAWAKSADGRDALADVMDAWWKSRMTPPKAGEPAVSGLSPLGLLRRAPWNLPINDKDTMYQAMAALMDMAIAEAAEVPASTQQMIDAFKAALGVDAGSPLTDDEIAVRLSEMLGTRAAGVAARMR